ncbi:MAG TPA: SDR family oxidoreductase, partial [Longimicrobiaceae bacterium]
ARRPTTDDRRPTTDSRSTHDPPTTEPMATTFFTGYPGFLGAELLPRVLNRSDDSRAVCLVQPRFAGLAHERLGTASARWPVLRGRVDLMEGDITRPDLGLGDGAAIAAVRDDISEIYHLAAIYDLSVHRDVALRVNVDGTRNVLRLAQEVPRLQRFHYVSTCYVSGRYPGVFREDQLEEGQTFNNAYEETKYLAEVEVQRAAKAGLPTTIYRPAIVVGDSLTGETQKYDGPYFVIQWLARQPRIAVMPVVGDTRHTFVNVVPRDYVVRAITRLSSLEASAGKVYQLADPQPLSVHDMLDVLEQAMGRRLLRIPLPLGVAKLALDRVPGVYRLMRIPSSSLDYFVLPTRYATGQAETDLAGSGIEVPRFEAYVKRLVEFVEAHPEIGSAAMA